MKSLYTIIFIIFISITAIAQDQATSKFTSDVGLKITSRHYWRGIPVSSAPCFEGSLAVKTGGFTLGYWGGYAFDNTYSEFDFFASYEIGNFTVSLWDLYVISDETDFLDYHPDQRYWDFDRETTTHNFDLTASYQFGDRFPLKVALSSMIWGADRDENGDQRYSTYLELGYPVKINPVTKLDFFLGTVLNNEDSAYGDSFGVVHTGASGTRVIKVSDTFSVPVTATLAMNPQKEIGYLIFAIGF
jgi:hypothetical protein